jgi:DNA primase
MAGRIPQHFIDELIARTDIVEVIGKRVPLRKAGREYSACCPFHDEKTPSFTVSPTKQFYHCFGCGAHGTAIGFLMEQGGLGFVEAVEDLAALAGMQVPRDADVVDPVTGVYEILERAAALYRRELAANPVARAYLRDRGIDDDVAAEFAIGYAPDAWDTLLRSLGSDRASIPLLQQAGLVVDRTADDGRARQYDRFRHRLMFPIRDARGRVIAFGGRVLGKAGEHEPKYLNSPETPVFHKGRELYGVYELRKALRDVSRVLVVEGYMDVVGLAQHGIRYACATLGTATTSEHLKRLARLCTEVVFCFDGDRAGRAAAWRALENALPALHGGQQLRFLFLPDGHDPDSLVRLEGAEAFAARLPDALPLSEFFVQRLAEQVDTGTVDGRARLAELARPLLARMPEGVYRQLLVERLAEAVRLPPSRLGPALGPSAAPQSKPRTPARAPRGGLDAGRDTPVRKAIRLVLNEPGVAAMVPNPAEAALSQVAGADLLAAIMEVARANPHITTAGLVETWRGRPEGRYLEKLAAQEVHLRDPAAAAVELRALLGRIQSEALNGRLNDLLRRADTLTDGEKRELQATQDELQRLQRELAASAAVTANPGEGREARL